MKDLVYQYTPTKNKDKITGITPNWASKEVMYLVKRKYPKIAHLMAGGYSVESKFDIELALKDVIEYKNMLEKMSAEERLEISKEEKIKEQEDLKIENEKAHQELKSRREREEAERFYNQPHAKADVDHLSKMDDWGIEQGLGAILGKNSDIVNSRSLKPYIQTSAFAKKYFKMLEVFQSAQRNGKIYYLTPPKQFLDCAKNKLYEVPKELDDKVRDQAERDRDWRSECETLQLEIEKLNKKLEENKGNEKTTDEKVQELIPHALIKAKENPVFYTIKKNFIPLLVNEGIVRKMWKDKNQAPTASITKFLGKNSYWKNDLSRQILNKLPISK